MLLLAAWIAAPVEAQESTAPAARTAESSAGVIGQRQTRAVVEEATRIKPMARIDSRISNRVRSRLRTRIDRDYAPLLNTTSAFDEADERVRDNQAVRPR